MNNCSRLFQKAAPTLTKMATKSVKTQQLLRTTTTKLNTVASPLLSTSSLLPKINSKINNNINIKNLNNNLNNNSLILNGRNSMNPLVLLEMVITVSEGSDDDDGR